VNTQVQDAAATNRSGAPLLQLEGLDVSYVRRGQPPVRAVVGASLSVGQGEIVGLVGESGCGKSTLGRAAVGLVAPSAGEVRYCGQPVRAQWRGARPSQFRSLQMVFQDPYSSLNPRRRVGRQIADAIRLGTGAKIGDDEAATRVGELLERVGLTPAISHRFPHEFSGGQCQRIAIARVLATEPSCVVADEPISSLDASAQAQVANLLAGIVAESGLGMLFISHDLSVVRKIADRTIVMYFGRIVESGPTERIWAEPAHPYTRGLIGAIPEPGAGSVLPSELKGDVPDPARPPPGCRFHPRCPVAMERCRTDDPPPVEVEPGWQSLCFLSEPRRSQGGEGAQAERETATSAGAA
jgi:oligopeptide/dipeptide ABC transporter ATP-binding protein